MMGLPARRVPTTTQTNAMHRVLSLAEQDAETRQEFRFRVATYPARLTVTTYSPTTGGVKPECVLTVGCKTKYVGWWFTNEGLAFIAAYSGVIAENFGEHMVLLLALREYLWHNHGILAEE